MKESKARELIVEMALSMFERRLTFGSSGNISVKIDGGQADWLKEHPEHRVRIIDRRLVTSEWFFDEPAPPGQASAGADVEPMRSEGYGHIEIAASHPAMVDD